VIDVDAIPASTGVEMSASPVFMDGVPADNGAAAIAPTTESGTGAPPDTQDISTEQPDVNQVAFESETGQLQEPGEGEMFDASFTNS
jgi:hypothetical protein